MTNYYIDYENVANGGFSGIEALPKRNKVYVFCRKDDIRHIKAFLKKCSSTPNIFFIEVKGNRRNALDFQLITYLARHIRKRDVSYIISRDLGYDGAIDMLKEEGYLVFRMQTISNGVEPIRLYKLPKQKKK